MTKCKIIVEWVAICLFLSLWQACSPEFQGLGPDPSETFLKLHGGDQEEIATSIVKTVEGYLLMGTTRTPSQNQKGEVYLVATDEAGEELWTQTLAANDGGSSVFAATILPIDSEEFLIGGTLTREGGRQDLWLVKTSNTGEEIWQRTYGLPSTSESIAAMALTDKNKLLILGTTTDVDPIKPNESHGGVDSSDIYLLHIDPDQNGALLWDKTMGYTGIDKGVDITALGDGSFAILGTTDYPQGDSLDTDVFIGIINEQGNLVNTQVFGNSIYHETPTKILQKANGNLLVVGNYRPYAQPNTLSNSNLLVLEVVTGLADENISNLPLSGFVPASFLIEEDEELIFLGTQYSNGSEDSKIALYRMDTNFMFGNPGLFGNRGKNRGTSLLASDGTGYVLVGTLEFASGSMLVQIKTDENFVLYP